MAVTLDPDDLVWLISLEIAGLRGFAEPQRVNLAIPKGSPGSGLTILVGPNNAGKSTVIEAFEALAVHPSRTPSFSEGKRNKLADERVTLRLFNSLSQSKSPSTVEGGGSETIWDRENIEPEHTRFFVVPSRRVFDTYFPKQEEDRQSYILSKQFFPRQARGLNFSSRLFAIEKNRSVFNNILRDIIAPVPQWYIEQGEAGQYYLKFFTGDQSHTSEGMGEGLVSILVIVDALYDSKPGDIIVIDEPELSLHPQFQKKLRDVLVRFAANRQIICATPSPRFIHWDAIINGAAIVRIRKREHRSITHHLSSESRVGLRAVLHDRHNPHVLVH